MITELIEERIARYAAILASGRRLFEPGEYKPEECSPRDIACRACKITASWAMLKHQAGWKRVAKRRYYCPNCTGPGAKLIQRPACVLAAEQILMYLTANGPTPVAVLNKRFGGPEHKAYYTRLALNHLVLHNLASEEKGVWSATGNPW